MNYPDLDVEDYIVHRNIAELPCEIRSILSMILDDISIGKSNGKAPNNLGEKVYGGYNLIPSDSHGKSTLEADRGKAR